MADTIGQRSAALKPCIANTRAAEDTSYHNERGEGAPRCSSGPDSACLRRPLRAAAAMTWDMSSQCQRTAKSRRRAPC